MDRELPVYEATADEFVGIHAATGLEERRYTEVRLHPTDFTGDPKELEPTPENIEWWDGVLEALGEYEVFILESRPEEAEALARQAGYESLNDFEGACTERDLEGEAYLKRRFLAETRGE